MFAAADRDLTPTDACYPANCTAHPADNPLHDPEIIENADETCEEDDHRERSDCKAVRERICRARPEQELSALGRVAKKVADSVRERLNSRASPAGVEHQERDDRLERESSANDANPDGASVRRQREGNSKNDDDPGDAEQLLIH